MYHQEIVRIQLVAPQVGLEPTANRLTADCSTTELLRKYLIRFYHN